MVPVLLRALAPHPRSALPGRAPVGGLLLLVFVTLGLVAGAAEARPKARKRLARSPPIEAPANGTQATETEGAPDGERLRADEPPEAVEDSEARVTEDRDDGLTEDDGADDRRRPLARPEGGPGSLYDPPTLPVPEDANTFLVYGFLCGTRCFAPPGLSHLVAPFLASWAGVGFMDSSEHFSTETKLATAAILLFADLAALFALGFVLSPTLPIFIIVAALISTQIALPLGIGMFAAFVVGISVAAWAATPILATYYLTMNKRRDLPYYHRYALAPASGEGRQRY